MAKFKKYGQYRPEQWRENLVKMEELFGQKELAKRLKTDPATIRRWKNGETVPKHTFIQRANNLFGNREVRESITKNRPRFEAAVERNEQRVTKLKEKPQVMYLDKWIDTFVDEPDFVKEEMIQELYSWGYDLAVYSKASPTEAQFVKSEGFTGRTAKEIAEFTGKPKGARAMYLCGTVDRYPWGQGNYGYQQVALEVMGDLFETWDFVEARNTGRRIFAVEINRAEEHKNKPNKPIRFYGFFIVK